MGRFTLGSLLAWRSTELRCLPCSNYTGTLPSCCNLWPPPQISHLLPPYGVPSKPCCGPSEERSAAGHAACLLLFATLPAHTDKLKSTPTSLPHETGSN